MNVWEINIYKFGAFGDTKVRVAAPTAADALVIAKGRFGPDSARMLGWIGAIDPSRPVAEQETARFQPGASW